MSETYDPYSVGQYPWMSVTLIIAIWASSEALRLLLTKSSKIFEAMTVEKKRNVVTYVLEIVVTTISLVAQLYGGYEILFLRQDYTSKERIEWMAFSLLLIALLYTWELSYRLHFGWPLLIHHLVTLLFIQLCAATFHDSPNMIYFHFAIIMAFNATTEQTSFVALLLYRFENKKAASVAFCVAAVQSLVIKTALLVINLWYYGYLIRNDLFASNPDGSQTSWDKFWIYCSVPLGLLLYASQLFSVKIMYHLSVRTRMEVKAKEQEEQDLQPSEWMTTTIETSLRSSENNMRAELVDDDISPNDDSLSEENEFDAQGVGLDLEDRDGGE